MYYAIDNITWRVLSIGSNFIVKFEGATVDKIYPVIRVLHLPNGTNLFRTLVIFGLSCLPGFHNFKGETYCTIWIMLLL